MISLLKSIIYNKGDIIVYFTYLQDDTEYVKYNILYKYVVWLINYYMNVY